ncbi:MAG: DUF308 domain-containing protein [Sphaerochaetaceae bacterium]|nr:DUF308 domain-containing protein [Sphaerochaetaceae bacterium]
MDNRKFIKLLVLGVVAIIIGSLIMNHSDSLLKLIMVVAGLAALSDGVYTLLGVRRWNFTSTTKTLAQVKGLESVVIGAAAIVIAIFLEAAITVMVYIFAAGLIFSSVVSFQNATMGKKFEIQDMRNHFMIEGVITLLIAIILICNPVGALLTIVKILGIVIIVIGALFVASAIIGKVRASKATSGATAEVGEAEVVESSDKTEN